MNKKFKQEHPLTEITRGQSHTLHEALKRIEGNRGLIIRSIWYALNTRALDAIFRQIQGRTFTHIKHTVKDIRRYNYDTHS